MKNIILPLVLLAYAAVSHSQAKHDYVWLLGYPLNMEEDSLGGTALDFNVQPRGVSFFEAPYWLGQSGSICGEDGQLAFYSNGCDIRNRHHEVMEGGEGINEGPVQATFCANGSYPANQGVLALPHPSRQDAYYLFHLRRGENTDTDFLYTEVDAAANDGDGAVLQKNVLAFQSELADQLTAVRHANGRDWWVVVPHHLGNRHYVFLLSPSGVEGPLVQDVGLPWVVGAWSGQACFSPDGRTYARMNPVNGLHLYNFDRCTGTLSSPRAIGFLDYENLSDGGYAAGVSVSPNNRFLYVSFTTEVYQFDLQAANVTASRKTVAVYDGGLSPFPVTFFQHALGPDGKIYITAHNGVNRMHIIHRPNEPGAACDFEQRGLRLTTMHAFAAPNFPHFRLWDEPDSPCDSLGIDAPVSVASAAAPPFDARLFPNPTTGSSTLLFEGVPPLPASLRLFNAIGQLVRQEDWLQAGRHEISLAGLPAGLYYAHATLADGRQRIFHLVKQ